MTLILHSHITNTNTNYLRDYYSNRPTPNDETEFDAYYLYQNAEEHININASVFSWIRDYLLCDISGSEYITEESQFSIPGYTKSLNWSISNNSIATIDNSGKLTAHGNGIVTIVAESYENGQLFRKKKNVLVGIPDIVITHSYSVGSGYQFTAVSTDEDATSLLSKLVSNGNFHYEWSFIDGNGNMSTQTTASNKFTYMPNTDEDITVAVRLIDNEGNKGPIKSFSWGLKTPMAVNYKFVIVDSQQNVFFIKENGTYETGVPTEDFAASFRYIPMNTNDNISQVEFKQKYLKGNDCYLSYPYGGWQRGYLKGTYQFAQTKWTFNFFDHALFLDELEDALTKTDGNERTITEFYLTICNTDKEDLQDVPFVIIYKPIFPEN